MGTIVYECRDRIVELENEMEFREVRIRRIRAVAVMAFIMAVVMMNTELFSALNVLNKSTFLLGMGMLTLTVYRLTKEGSDAQKTRTLMFTGAAFLLTSLFAMVV